MDATERNDFEAASRESDRLDALQFRLKSAEPDPKENGNSNGVLNLLESYSLDLRGNMECAKGHLDAGLKLLRQAADVEKKKVGYAEPPAYGKPEAESIGYAYLLAGQFDKARAAFEDELKLRPGRHAGCQKPTSLEQSRPTRCLVLGKDRKPQVRYAVSLVCP
jgi:tetratricopeptide (TPR) repeat protein